MKKYILVLAALLLVAFVATNASATMECVQDDQCDNSCEVVIDEPIEGEWYDPVTIRWHYEGDCQPFEYQLAYQEGTCDGDVWQQIASDITPNGGNNNVYEWDVTNMPDGEYCVAANMDQLSGPDAGGVSGVWYLDLTPPEVSEAYVSSGPEVPCEDDSCKSYVTSSSKISFGCTDHDGSGVDYKEYQYRVDGGEWQGPFMYPTGGFSFPETSNHELEYWCFDNVGKESDHMTTTFIVDNEAPTIERTVDESGVLAEGEDFEYYLTTNTKICVDFADPEPHPVGLDEYGCEYYWNDDTYDVEFDEDGCFTYDADSFHELYCYAADALGNDADMSWFDAVDAMPPTTTHEYLGPYYSNEGVEYIDGVSTVELSSEDYGPHAVGVETTYYRYEVVDDDYCLGDYEGWETSPTEAEDWMVYEEPFGMDESCHVVEYYSVDAFGNEEEVNYDFVFVDKTAPEVEVSSVGSPSHNCNSLYEDIVGRCEEGWDWIVSMDTPITLSCSDGEPHPSGVSGIWYRVILDGNEEELHTDWTFAETDEFTLSFYEESEHLVEFYCVDNVEKESEHHEVLFKVEGEIFTLELEEKWNLVSIPFNLLSGHIDEVFADDLDKIIIIWTYDEDGWHVYNPEHPELSDLETLEPGYGYWIKTTEDFEVDLGGSLLSPGPGLPPARQLMPGWNLIGHYGIGEAQSYCSLFSLIDTQEGHPRWSSLYGFTDGETGVFEGLDLWDYTEAGEGYWVEMDVADQYNPATVCWDFWD